MGAPGEDLADRVKRAVDRKVNGHAVPGGRDKRGIECFALVNWALGEAGAKTAADFGENTPNADYVWGEAVDLDAVKPGYILQFRDHVLRVQTYTLGEFKWQPMPDEKPKVRPHHAAVIWEVLKEGGVKVAEQYVKPDIHKVNLNTILRLDRGSETRMISPKEKIFIEVTGYVWAYRPVPK
jgi:hypothetical protein